MEQNVKFSKLDRMQALLERVQELEKAMTKLVKIEVPLPECAVCWERDKCTDRAHGDNCLAIGFIIDTAMEAAKEARKCALILSSWNGWQRPQRRGRGRTKALSAITIGVLFALVVRE